MRNRTVYRLDQVVDMIREACAQEGSQYQWATQHKLFAAVRDGFESLLTQCTAECDALKLVNDTHMKTVMKLSHVVEQRTAELEAAKAELNTVRRDAGLDCGDNSCLYAMNKTGMRTNGGCRCSPKRMKDDLGRSRKACDDLQAELERVRGELVEATHNANVYQSLYSTGCMDRALLENELRDIRTLILTLPKVEGEIVAQAGYVKDRKKVYACFGSDADMTAYAALLTHRQGMEGVNES